LDDPGKPVESSGSATASLPGSGVVVNVCFRLRTADDVGAVGGVGVGGGVDNVADDGGTAGADGGELAGAGLDFVATTAKFRFVNLRILDCKRETRTQSLTVAINTYVLNSKYVDKNYIN
jgi:hypothetical protein